MSHILILFASICWIMLSSSYGSTSILQQSYLDSFPQIDSLHHILDSTIIRALHLQDIKMSSFKTDSGDVIVFMKTPEEVSMTLNVGSFLAVVDYSEVLDEFSVNFSSASPESSEASVWIEGKNGLVTKFDGVDSKENAEHIYATTFYYAFKYVEMVNDGKAKTLEDDIATDELRSIIKIFLTEGKKCDPIIKKMNEQMQKK